MFHQRSEVQAVAVVNTEKMMMSANQFAAKAMQLRLKGKLEEAEKLLQEEKVMDAKHGNEDHTTGSSTDGSSSRYAMQKIPTQQERCLVCLENPNRPMHLIVSVTSFTYPMLPQWQPVVPGHCCILPIQAIDEAEDEWSQQDAKKLIDTSQGELRNSIPKHFPYFHVEFGLHKSFAHVIVIDDEKHFKSSFGPNVIRGMLHLAEVDTDRRPRHEAQWRYKSKQLLAFLKSGNILNGQKHSFMKHLNNALSTGLLHWTCFRSL